MSEGQPACLADVWHNSGRRRPNVAHSEHNHRKHREPHLQPPGPMTPCACSSEVALAFSSSTMISSTLMRCSMLRSEPKLCAAVASRPRTILHCQTISRSPFLSMMFKCSRVN